MKENKNIDPELELKATCLGGCLTMIVLGILLAIVLCLSSCNGGLRMLSAEAWAMATEFIRAQNNVLSEFRQEGLL